jgi:hypothetical protein
MTGRSFRDTKAKFGRRLYLPKEAREMANREARKIQVNQPDYVEDAEDPSLTDVFRSLRRRPSDFGEYSRADDVVLIQIMSEVEVRDAIRYFLWAYSGLSPREVVAAEMGRDKVPFSGEQSDGEGGLQENPEDHRQRLRDVKASLQDTAEAMGDEDLLRELRSE